MAEKIDGQTYMGTREATSSEHAQHVEAGYYVARLKGGTKLHLRKMGGDAICGAAPSSRGGLKMVNRSGWQTFKQDGTYRATCVKCLDGFRPTATFSGCWPFPNSTPPADSNETRSALDEVDAP